MLTIRSTNAHVKKDHPLTMAHSPTYAVHGQTVYVVCGFGGCAQHLEVDAAVWREEEARRRATPPAPAMPEPARDRRNKPGPEDPARAGYAGGKEEASG